MGPGEIVRAFAAALASGELWPHIAASLSRSLPGFAVGALGGTIVGLSAGVSRGLEEMVSGPIFLTYPVPKIVMLPLVMLWFGIGDVSKVVIIALACFYPAFIHAYDGARSTRTILAWSALSMGASRWRMLVRVVVPSALPSILTGLRVAMALSFILLFAAEMAGSRSGLGWLIKQAEQGLRFDLMYVSILTIAILGWLGDTLLRVVRLRVVRWEAA